MGTMTTHYDGKAFFEPDDGWYPEISCIDCGHIMQEYAERNR
jgi:hypothetical protein